MPYEDLSSRFAMKIAKSATLEDITQKTRPAFAADAGLGATHVRRRVREVAETIREAAPRVADELTENGRMNDDALARFAPLVAWRRERILKTM